MDSCCRLAQPTVIDLILPNDQVGSVIGLGGAKINDIRSDSSILTGVTSVDYIVCENKHLINIQSVTDFDKACYSDFVK